MKTDLQKAFLEALVSDGQIVSVFLQRGVQLKGKIKCFDNDTIFLEDAEGRLLMVYKQTVTTISPSKPLGQDIFSGVMA